MNFKVCKKCGIKKYITEFSKHPTSKYGCRPECKVCRNKQSRLFYLKNKDIIDKKHKEYDKSHKQQINKYQIEYVRQKRKTDLSFRILNNFRRRLLKALNNECKIESSLNLLGCTSKDLKQYLESRFKSGMTWNNYGLHGWHIDHIKPCSKFDLSKVSEQRECFHYTNLQPLWAEENWKKSNRYNTIIS